MPTYTYQCDSCGHGFETVQRFADEPLTECPECGSRIRRVIQPVGVVFKGSGWYITDSRAKSSTGDAESSSRSTTVDKDKVDKAGKADKPEKPAKSDTSDKPAKTEKTTAKVAD